MQYRYMTVPICFFFVVVFCFLFSFFWGVWVAGEGSCLFKRLSAHANGN